MNNIKKLLAILGIIFYLNTSGFVLAEETTPAKYPDYAYEYVGVDKHEDWNRKMFSLNSKLNKYAIKPIHTVWASIMPKYMMDRIQSAYINIQYPKRLISSICQKNLKDTKNETIRFFTNTTIGLGGMYDPAKKLFHIDSCNDGIEQALANSKIKPGSFLVMPCIPATCPRDMIGNLFDFALNPTTYIATPAIAFAKLGFTVNRTAYMQPIVKMIESTYADPYEITKELYGLESYIKNHHLNRDEILDTQIQLAKKENAQNKNTEETIAENNLDTKTYKDKEENVVNIKQDKNSKDKNSDEAVLKVDKSTINPDIILSGYDSQCPVTDSMRTALFELPEINDSMWNELSIWNRCFSKQIKTSSVNIDPQKPNYNYKYIMQHDKNSPVAIIYPSIGEGINAHHSVILAKLFYDKGYSVIIEGSNFQWEFVKSMPDGYRPGIVPKDADALRLITSKVLDSLQSKYNCQFSGKVVIGTSYGAIATLFLGNEEYKNNTLGITKFIAINPPVDLIYAMKQMDNNAEEWKNNPEELKERVAITAAKVIALSDMKSKDKNFKIETLPFSEYEAKLITGFVMHQKLSDLMYTIENVPKNKNSDFYKMVNNMDYHDYVQKYLVGPPYKNVEDMGYITSLYSISDYLKNSNDYKIYHSVDDYLVTTKQLSDLKGFAKDKLVLLNHGGHLGFLYRPEFLQSLTQDITLGGPQMAGVKNNNDKATNEGKTLNTLGTNKDNKSNLKELNTQDDKKTVNNTISINTLDEYDRVVNY